MYYMYYSVVHVVVEHADFPNCTEQLYSFAFIWDLICADH